MQAHPYDSLTKALAAVGLVGQRQGEDQLIVSSQQGPVWPNRGNSFWTSYKRGVWYLSTWLPVGYRVPEKKDVLALCQACMSAGASVMYRVPPEVVANFELQELDEIEYERLFPTGATCD
jgi:hypothetical protein